ncbi:MAG: hypothetical protein QM762_00950 [Chryseolinea sp.]
MMNRYLTIVTVFFSPLLFAQNENPDLDKLVAIGELYSPNSEITGFNSSVEKLRSPNLNHIIDALIAANDEDDKLLTKRFLTKPGQQELRYWYVIREIHYNRNATDKAPRPNREVAMDVLQQDIDERWLLDNYYYRILNGIAMLFNKTDLSSGNIDLNVLSLKDDTEKAILFFALCDALITRFQVLQMVKNNDKLLEFASRLPSINGLPYYQYTAFSFEEFDWIGYDKSKPFKQTKLSHLYSCLSAHFGALIAKGENEKARDLYVKSILSRPEYFKYAGTLEPTLKELYNKTRN